MLPRPESILGKRKSENGMYQKRTKYASKSKRYRKLSIPRAISTRGTPEGYYEIPVTTLTRVYFNTSTGFWQTDQTTGAQIGLTGYNGFSWTTTLDNSILALGNGSVSTAIVQNVPGWSGPQNTFDLVKVAKVIFEVEFVNALHTTGISNAGGVYFTCAFDPNDNVPPAFEATVLQYSNIKTLTNGNYGKIKMPFTPYILDVIGSNEDAPVSAGAQRAMYVRANNPSISHRGVVGWLSTFLTSTATANTGYMMLKVTQIRRYKINR